MSGIRGSSFAFAALALFGAAAAQAAPLFIPLTQQTAGSLKYGGSLLHPLHGSAHTFLAPTLAECSSMLAQSQQQHADGTHVNCHYTDVQIQPCQKRGFFELVAPTGGGIDGVTTIMVHVPSDVVRLLGDLRERYRIDAYEADVAKLGDD